MKKRSVGRAARLPFPRDLSPWRMDEFRPVAQAASLRFCGSHLPGCWDARYAAPWPVSVIQVCTSASGAGCQSAIQTLSSANPRACDSVATIYQVDGAPYMAPVQGRMAGKDAGPTNCGVMQH